MMTQQLASSTPIEGLMDFGPKGAPEGAVEGDPFSQILAQFTGLPAADAAPPAAENGEVVPAAAMLKLAAGGLPAKAGESVEGGEPADADGDEADAEEPQLPLLAALMAPTTGLAPQTPAAPAKAEVASISTAKAATPAIAPSLPGVEAAAPAPKDPAALAGENLAVALKALLPGQDRKEGAKAPSLHGGTAQAGDLLAASPGKADSGTPDVALPVATAATAPLVQTPLDVAAPLAPAADIAMGPANADAAKVDAAGPATQLVERHLNLAHEGEWLDRLARDIAHSAGGDGSLRFRLNPEHLGSLHVELTQGAAGTSLRLTADSEAARAIIADAQPRLVAEARAHGVKIAEAHVDLGGREQSFQGQSFQGQSFAGDQRGQRHLRGEEYLTTFKPEPSDGALTRRTARHASDRYA